MKNFFKPRLKSLTGILFGATLLLAGPVLAQEATDDVATIAKKAANPVASLAQLPLQFNYDARVGPDRIGNRLTLNVQPVIPVPLNAKWNVISRTIVPVVWQNDITRTAGTNTETTHVSGSQFGIGDIVQSLFFTPTKYKGIIWGVGPVLLLPTGTDQLLSTKKWGAGPTGVVLKQMGGWTVGALVSHTWSFAGNNERQNFSFTIFNPFLSHVSKTAFTTTILAESTYDWLNDRFTLPVTLSGSQLKKVGGQLISFGAGVRYYAAATAVSPHGVAGRVTVTLLFPAKQLKTGI